jgi:hypothetical protein
VNAYVVNVYVGNVLQASRLLAPSMTRQTVGGLSNHVTYRFTVAANNNYGLSVASAMTTNVTPSLGASAGVEFECNSSSWSDAERQSVLDTMWNSGARWVRIPVDWSTVEPTAKKSYNFALNDKCVSLAKKRGFRVLQTLSATPAWANGNRGASVPPTTVTDYGDIAQVMAARYNGSHGVGRVDAWEIWNEPNTSAWTGSVAQYVALVKAAYPRVHKGFVHAAVVVGAPAYNSSLFVRTLYDAGLTGASFDVISVHPFQNPSDSAPDAADPAPGSYGMPADGYMTHTPTVASLLASHGDDGKPIWWTAFGWSTCSGTITGQSTSCVTEQTQADDIVGAMRQAATYPAVGVTFVYTARDESTDISSWVANRGLLHRNLTAKSALAAVTNYLLERTPHNGSALWSASMENGNLNEWSTNGGGGMYDSGSSSASTASGIAHTGSESLKATINTSTGEAGVRAFRWEEARANRDAYYSVWLYVPTTYNLSGSERWWNVFQFKSRNTADTRVDPLWGFYADQDAGGLYLHAGWGWGGTAVAGPHAGDGTSGKWFAPQTKVYLPVGRWTHLEAYLHESKDFDGILRFWQDGTLLYDLSSIRTSYNNCNFNSWCADNEWSVNLYSDGMSPSPSTAYFDDALITR